MVNSNPKPAQPDSMNPTDDGGDIRRFAIAPAFPVEMQNTGLAAALRERLNRTHPFSPKELGKQIDGRPDIGSKAA
jgi:hypothetical protein